MDNLAKITNLIKSFEPLISGEISEVEIKLSVDATPIAGGGYLHLDFDTGQYDGILELAIGNVVTIKAIGLITTQMPDGTESVSVLVILTAEFPSGIQLGFGFKLTGLGGLVGVNRRRDLEALMAGVQSGSLDSVLFPADPVNNAHKIIADLKAFFPPKDELFLVGPMAKIGWGPGDMISISVGVVLQFPGAFDILGDLKVAVPDPEAPLVKINVNFLGGIDFDKKELYFLSTIYDSKIFFLKIEGGMGLLLNWGENSNFVLTVGGFHPSFDAPKLPFDEPARLAVRILDKDHARIYKEGYFAITSNTVQFGSRSEVFFGFDAFNVSGAFGYDALFYFNPFRFLVGVSGSMELEVFGVGALSISLDLDLEGPEPWMVKGKGTFEILFIDIDVDISETWGGSQDETPEKIKVLEEVKKELEYPDSWTAELPPSANLLVTLRNLGEAADSKIMHPAGSLRISQKFVPLDISIDKIGPLRPVIEIDTDDGALSLTCDKVRIELGPDSSGLEIETEATEPFAMAQFRDMGDTGQLSAKAFSKQHSGLILASSEAIGYQDAVQRNVRYELSYIPELEESASYFEGYSTASFAQFLQGNAVAQSPLSQQYKMQYNPFWEKIAIESEGFSIVDAASNSLSEYGSFISAELAQETLDQLTSAGTVSNGQFHIIPNYEVNLFAVH